MLEIYESELLIPINGGVKVININKYYQILHCVYYKLEFSGFKRIFKGSILINLQPRVSRCSNSSRPPLLLIFSIAFLLVSSSSSLVYIFGGK